MSRVKLGRNSQLILRPREVAPILCSMWTEFLLITILAIGLLFSELRRLASTYGSILAVVVGGAAVVAVAVWLLGLLSVGFQLTGVFKIFDVWYLLATFVIPLSAFLYARRRFSVAASLLPAGLMLAFVSFVFLNIAIGLAYSS